jgi:hypothetical protein
MVKLRYIAFASLVALIGLGQGCSYRYYAGDFKPQSETDQGQGRSVADDGTVTFSQGRLDISLRPMTDEELNRQFSANSSDGVRSTNPYTYGTSTHFRTGETPQRFTVFKLSVSNYEYPKVYIDPTQIFIKTGNERKYYALTFPQLNVYYRRYALGGQSGLSDGGIPGNNYQDWKKRINVLKRTLFPDEQIFSAQEVEGYLVFETMAPDVEALTVHIPNTIIRFDYKGDPSEDIEVTMNFEREIGRKYPDGRLELSTK